MCKICAKGGLSLAITALRPHKCRNGGSESTWNVLVFQSNPQMVKNSSLRGKLISGSVLWYGDSIISVRECGEGKKIRSKSVDLKKNTSFPLWVRVLKVKKHFPLQLVGYFLQHVLSEELKAVLEVGKKNPRFQVKKQNFLPPNHLANLWEEAGAAWALHELCWDQFFLKPLTMCCKLSKVRGWRCHCARRGTGTA